MMAEERIRVQTVSEEGAVLEAGWLHPRLTGSGQGCKLSGLLNLVNLATKLRDHKINIKTASEVLQKIMGESDDGVFEVLKALGSKRITDRSQALTRILIPNKLMRNQVEELRLSLLQSVKQKNITDSADVHNFTLLSQLYTVLTLGSQSFPCISDGEQQWDQIKKSLTSLRKMMGNDSKMEESDKREKKKAYELNICVRYIFEECISDFSPQIKVKLQKVLKLSKSRKWFGARLYKLLVQQHWSLDEMHLFAQQLINIYKQKRYPNRQKTKTRPMLRQIYQGILRYIEKCKKMESEIGVHNQQQRLKYSVDSLSDDRLLIRRPSSVYSSLFDNLLEVQ